MTKRKKTMNLRTLRLEGDWGKHIDAVRPAIKAIDRRTAESTARAPLIAVTNSTK